MNRQSAALVVFDGGCPLCGREIAHYRRRRGAERIEWVDATRDAVRLSQLGLDYQQAMRVFHVLDREGDWHTGASGFVLLWSTLPAYRPLAGLVRRLGLLPLLEWGYRRFLRWRSPRRCTPSTCQQPRGGEP